jgi:hypothetical protein
MARKYGILPANKDEAVKIAMSIRDEDIDLSEMPEMGDGASWRSGAERKTYSPQRQAARKNIPGAA